MSYSKYGYCKWCDGRGCIVCKARKEPELPPPMFTADRNDPADMEALARVFGAEALQKAFGPEGGGIREVEKNAAIESITQAARKAFVKTEGGEPCA